MPGAFATVFRGVVRFDRTAFAPGAAVRCAAGVGICLAVGLLTDHLGAGFAAAVGALSVGYASFQGTYRTRAAAMVFAAIGMAVSTLVGALSDQPAWLAAVMVGVWGWSVGMLSALGMAARVVGLQWAVAFVVVHQFPMTATQALGRAGLVLVGGLLQTVLVVAVWPLRRFAMERETLAAVYRALASYAADASQLPPAKPLIVASNRLTDPQPFARDVEVQAFRALLEQAERIRVSLAGLPPAAAASASEPLSAIAEAVADGRAPHDVHLQEVDDRLRNLMVTAVEQAAVPAGGEPAPDSVPRRGEDRIWRRMLEVRRAALALRANLSLDSETFRHAVRLGMTMAAGVVVYRAANLPHGYWVPLTALVVLRPDFLETFTRGLARIGGTIIGAGLATVLVATVRPGQAELTLLVIAAAWLAYAVLRVNYAVFATCVTALIALLLAFAGLPELAAAKDRVFDTLIGGGLALVAYATWPTWEKQRVRQRLADLLELQGQYGCAVLRAYMHPDTHDGARLRDIQTKARLARSNAESSVDRLLAEPAGNGRVPVAVLATMQRFAGAALSLQASLPHHEGVPPAAPGLEEIARRMSAELAALASQLRTGTPSEINEPMNGDIQPEEAQVMVASVERVAEVLRGEPS